MSLLHSPKKTCHGSCSDLPNAKDNDNLKDKPQITFRKRKELEPDFSIKQEFESLRNEMRSFMTSFSNLQNENMSIMQQDMNEIKEQLSGIRLSTEKVVEEQSKIKDELENLRRHCIINENSIKSLQNEVNRTKSIQIPPSSTQSQTSPFTYEELLTEIQERTQRQKNIIIIGVPESSHENTTERVKYDTNEVLNVLQTIEKSCPHPLKIFRIGKYVAGRNRPLKACFESEQIVMRLLRNRTNIKNNIKLYSDQTYNQRSYLNQLKSELMQRQENGEENITIKYIKGTPKIVAQQPKN